MNPTIVKMMTFGGLALTLAGTIVSAIATNQSQQLAINEAVSAKIAELTK